nr:hypothetical protein CFP56_60747 [Quercus suber]
MECKSLPTIWIERSPQLRSDDIIESRDSMLLYAIAFVELPKLATALVRGPQMFGWSAAGTASCISRKFCRR